MKEENLKKALGILHNIHPDRPIKFGHIIKLARLLELIQSD